jgi:hypothetical protein
LRESLPLLSIEESLCGQHHQSQNEIPTLGCATGIVSYLKHPCDHCTDLCGKMIELQWRWHCFALTQKRDWINPVKVSSRKLR